MQVEGNKATRLLHRLEKNKCVERGKFELFIVTCVHYVRLLTFDEDPSVAPDNVVMFHITEFLMVSWSPVSSDRGRTPYLNKTLLPTSPVETHSTSHTVGIMLNLPSSKPKTRWRVTEFRLECNCKIPPCKQHGMCVYGVPASQNIIHGTGSTCDSTLEVRTL